MQRELISRAQLLDLLDYDPSTGIFLWRKSPNPRAPAGSIAGCGAFANFGETTADADSS